MTATVNRRSAIIPIPALTDENDTALTFGALITPTWTLTTDKGKVINLRENVALTALYVVLTGADTDLYDNNPRRKLTIKATYTSATYGVLNLNTEFEFNINNLVGA